MALKVLMILPIGKAKNLQSRVSAFTPPLRARTGFTLIELLLVVAILAVVAGVNLPAFSKTYNRLRLENCALSILSIARYTREKAIVESKTHRLNFNIENKTYWITSLSEDPLEEPERIGGRFARIFQIPADISIEASSDFINFYPNGDSDDAVVILTNSRGLEQRIIKSGVFGEFKIKKEKS